MTGYYRWYLCALLLVAPAPVSAQRKISEKDSIAAQMDAVEALRNFQYQYGLLVLTPRRRDEQETLNAIFGSCEIRVVDFCYGPLNGKLKYGGIGTYISTTLLSSEMPKVWQRRSDGYINRYLNELVRVQKKVPGDRWVNGELVRLHIEHGFPVRARDAVDKCQDSGWWCTALRAYAIHASGSWLSADSLWSVALARMSPRERCEWLDPTLAIDDKKLRELLSEVPCEELEKLQARFWWLSDPFFAKAGNERRSAHLSRSLSLLLDNATQERVYAIPAMVREGRVEQLRELSPVDVDAPLLQTCGDFGTGEQGIGLRLLHGYPDLVTRVGVPAYCGYIDEPGPTSAPAGRAGGRGAAVPPPRVQFTQFPLSRQSFLPMPEAFAAPLQSLASDWKLRDPQAFEFMSGWTRLVLDFSYQAAWFKRADSARLVVAATEAPQTLPKDMERPVINQLSGDLWLQSDFDQPSVHFKANGTTRLLFNSMVAPRRTLASVEAENPRGPFGRVRFGTGPQEMPAQRVTLSDILLVEASYGRDTLGATVANNRALPVNLEDAAPRALPTTTLREGSATGLFWEIYGLNRGETPHVSVFVVRQTGREAQRLGRVARPSGADVISTEWDETAVAGAAIEPRSVNINLATLPRGRYTLSVAVTVPGQEVVESVRTIEIVR